MFPIIPEEKIVFQLNKKLLHPPPTSSINFVNLQMLSAIIGSSAVIILSGLSLVRSILTWRDNAHSSGG